MESNKVKVEIFEADPFGSACCGPGLLSSPDAQKRLRLIFVERNQIAEKLIKEFKNAVQVDREIISQKRFDYPEYVRKLMFDGKPLPYIFINREAVATGKFPTYEEFVTLLKSHFKNEATS